MIREARSRKRDLDTRVGETNSIKSNIDKLSKHSQNSGSEQEKISILPKKNKDAKTIDKVYDIKECILTNYSDSKESYSHTSIVSIRIS